MKDGVGLLRATGNRCRVGRHYLSASFGRSDKLICIKCEVSCDFLIFNNVLKEIGGDAALVFSIDDNRINGRTFSGNHHTGAVVSTKNGSRAVQRNLAISFRTYGDGEFIS